ncbi:MAG: hypothetical protein ACUVX1_10980 [Chloroflexota bacterium]
MDVTFSKTVVRLADDYRDNLIVDRYDASLLMKMSRQKGERLRSENSEDVPTWNVFRSLRQNLSKWHLVTNVCSP